MKYRTIEKMLSEFDYYLNQLPQGKKRVGIKVNLQSPPKENAPRTDSEILRSVILHLKKENYEVVLLEGANGYLKENIKIVGLGDLLDNHMIECIDLDCEENVSYFEKNGRCYPIPQVLNDFDIRIALPCASKRSGYMFSCNVKTFVGLLPRKLCKNGTLSIFSRPLIHENLTETVADLYEVVNENIPFDIYITGGNTFSQYSDIKQLPYYYITSNAINLDTHLVNVLGAETPGYLDRLRKMQDEK